MDNVAVNIGYSKVSATVTINKLFVINAHEVE